MTQTTQHPALTQGYKRELGLKICDLLEKEALVMGAKFRDINVAQWQSFTLTTLGMLIESAILSIGNPQDPNHQQIMAQIVADVQTQFLEIRDRILGGQYDDI